MEVVSGLSTEHSGEDAGRKRDARTDEREEPSLYKIGKILSCSLSNALYGYAISMSEMMMSLLFRKDCQDTNKASAT